MTLSSTTNKVQYDGTGAQVSFPVTFAFWSLDDLRVIHRSAAGVETVWTRGTQYTLTGGSGSTGTLTVSTSPTDYTPAVNTTLTIKSNLSNTQPTNLPAGGAFPSDSVEERMDQIVRLIQQRSEELDRSLKFAESDSSSLSPTIPNSSDRASKYLAFDSSGNPTASAVAIGSAVVTAFMETLLDDVDAATARTTLGVATAATASTTEVLTGTDATKIVTADALAALWEQGSDIASAGTISVGEGGYFNVTGTTTITDIDFATDKAGRKAWLKFAGALTLTHNATTLILPGGANIVTAAGDIACFISEGADAVRCVAYTVAALIPGSKVVQTVSTQTGALATGTTVMPYDDTIPQNTEGDQYLSLAITPKSATNNLLIEIVLTISSSANNQVVAALFQDATAGALAATADFAGASGGLVFICFSHVMVAGTTSATTFKTRAGPSSAATITLNGASSARLFGGVAVSAMRITEYTP